MAEAIRIPAVEGTQGTLAGNYTIRFIPQCDGMNLLTLTKN